MKDMKRVIIIMVLGALMACLVPALAQNPQDWKSTSSMPSTGSTYAPQVTAVGAPMITTTTTTTESYSPAKVGPRRNETYNDDDWGVNPQVGEGDEASPVGEPWIMVAFALAFGGVIALRRRRRI